MYILFLEHSVDQFIDVNISWSMGSLVQVAVSLFLDSLLGRVESEWEEEICNFLEVLSERVDLVDNVLHASDSVLSKGLVDELVGAQWDFLSVELSKPSLVDEILNGLSGWVSVGDIWLDSSEHVHDGLVVFKENCVADSEQSEQTEDFSLLWSNLGKSFDSDDQEIRALLLYEELVVKEGLSLLLDQLSGLVFKVLVVFLALVKSIALELLLFLDFQVLALFYFVFQLNFLLFLFLEA